jgi:excinuclease UvrABC nuclease subunit
LCDEELGRVPAKVAGVYMLQSFSPEHGIYAVLYAGKAADLLARLTQHLRSVTTAPEVRLARGRLRLFFSAAPVLDDALRSAIEAGLIVRFRPPFNRQIPRTAPVAASLPPFLP